MFVCEGCHQEFSKGNINVHLGKCPEYLVWSKQLPFSCPCGRHFGAERSLRSHKKGCNQAEVLRPGGHTCVCGQTYWSVAEHRQVCPGAPVVVLPPDVPDPGDWGCPCGKNYSESQNRSSVDRHRQGCAWWHTWQKTLPVKCEGCGLGFHDVFGKRSHAQVCRAWQEWRTEKDAREKTVPCPSCGELMRGPQLGLHVHTCPGPWRVSDWERHRQQSKNRRTALRDPTLEVGSDFVTCLLCGDRFRALSVHLITQHGMTVETYRYELSGSVFSRRSGAKRRASMMATYGAPTPLQNPDISRRAEAKRKGTCQARYGGDSPFTGGLTTPPKKNGLEAKVEMLSPPTGVYVGVFVRFHGTCVSYRFRE
jgi:hypothetical protein